MIKEWLFASLMAFSVAYSATSQDMFYTFTEKGRLSINQEELINAKTLSDIHDLYRHQDVKEYIKTKITVIKGDTHLSSSGESHDLNPDQKSLIRNAKPKSKLLVDVDYIPNNDLAQNPAKTMSYKFEVVPKRLATFESSDDDLHKYVDSHILNRLTKEQKNNLKAGRLSFNIDQNGEVKNVMILDSSKMTEVDDLLLNTFCQMPKWQPAQSSDGNVHEQKIIFFISNAQGICMQYGSVY